MEKDLKVKDGPQWENLEMSVEAQTVGAFSFIEQPLNGGLN